MRGESAEVSDRDDVLRALHLAGERHVGDVGSLRRRRRRRRFARDRLERLALLRIRLLVDVEGHEVPVAHRLHHRRSGLARAHERQAEAVERHAPVRALVDEEHETAAALRTRRHRAEPAGAGGVARACLLELAGHLPGGFVLLREDGRGGDERKENQEDAGAHGTPPCLPEKARTAPFMRRSIALPTSFAPALLRLGKVLIPVEFPDTGIPLACEGEPEVFPWAARRFWSRERREWWDGGSRPCWSGRATRSSR